MRNMLTDEPLGCSHTALYTLQRNGLVAHVRLEILLRMQGLHLLRLTLPTLSRVGYAYLSSLSKPSHHAQTSNCEHQSTFKQKPLHSHIKTSPSKQSNKLTKPRLSRRRAPPPRYSPPPAYRLLDYTDFRHSIAQDPSRRGVGADVMNAPPRMLYLTGGGYEALVVLPTGFDVGDRISRC
jgi:hypothetical protein